MHRHKLILTYQTQIPRGTGQRASCLWFRPLPKPYHHSRQFYARQSARQGRSEAPRSKNVSKTKYGTYLALSFTSFLLIKFAYVPLRDHGVLDDIATRTVFRAIPPKRVELADAVDDTRFYQPITQDNEIRLLVLEPGTPGDELECHLINVKLSWRTRYEAISYAWGDESVTRQLSCSGRTMDVHVTLHDALSDLRHTDRQRLLWVDRLCINQADNDEKSKQIMLMKDIYSQARQVLIYLGKQDPAVEKAMEAISQADWQLAPLVTGDIGAFYILRYLFRKDEINWGQIINLLRRPWFRRTWVIQETVLAKRAQVICGDQSIPWIVLEKSVDHMRLYKAAFKNIPAYESVDEIVSGIAFMASARQTRHPGCKIPGSATHVEDDPKLLDLILESRSFACKDPRDKVFGMLGITGQHTGSAYLTPDYSIQPEEVFRKFVLWEILNNNSLGVLGSSSDKAGSQYSSPSWVPDFTKLDSHHNLTGTMNRVKFDASAGSSQQAWTSNEETVLHLKGRIVDTLHTVGKKSATAPDNFIGIDCPEDKRFESLSHLRVNKEMIEEARDIWLAATKRATHYLGSATKFSGLLAKVETDGQTPSKWLPFLRTLVCNRTQDGEAAEKDFIVNNVASFVRQTLEVDLLPEYFLQQSRSEAITGLQAFLRLTESRRFAGTRMGLTGYVPVRARKGDIICILYGADVPFVIRREGGGKYSLVGECYMHGIMNGEAFRMAELKDQAEEVFTLV